MTRLRRLESEFGLQSIYLSKSQPEIISDYKISIASAKRRVWAMGLSNNQFVNQHLTTLKSRKQEHPNLDVKVFFFDPDVRLTAATSINDLPAINLFDFPTQKYESEKRVLAIREIAKQVATAPGLSAEVFFVLLASYFSVLIVDDVVYFFPFLDIEEDASSNPVLVFDTRKPVGARFVEHMRRLSQNKFLSRRVT